MYDTQDKDIEKLIAEINTREASTLVFSTVAASVSLALLAGILNVPDFRGESWFIWIGLLFSILGFLYREFTIHASDIPNYNKLRKLLGNKCEEENFAIKVGQFSRMIVIRSFMLLPIGAWFLLIMQSSGSILELVFSRF